MAEIDIRMCMTVGNWVWNYRHYPPKLELKNGDVIHHPQCRGDCGTTFNQQRSTALHEIELKANAPQA